VGKDIAPTFDGRPIAGIDLEEDEDELQMENHGRLAQVDPVGHPSGGMPSQVAAKVEIGPAGNSLCDDAYDFGNDHYMEPPAVMALLANERRRPMLRSTPAGQELVLNSLSNQPQGLSMRDGGVMEAVIHCRRAELGNRAITANSYGRKR
jgi:hypothetical protein